MVEKKRLTPVNFEDLLNKLPCFMYKDMMIRDRRARFMYATPSQQFQSTINHHNPNNPPWRKLLWVKQDYPDNYVDSTFLDELQRNVNMRTYDYWTMVHASGGITQHISSVVIFIAIFIDLQTHTLSANHLIWTGSLLTGAGYLFLDLMMLRKTENYDVK
ncbi:hypothetical protein PHYBLDRAFT_174455, partial [Phycomyces blakesleeanus NRRL 1555(-)]